MQITNGFVLSECDPFLLFGLLLSVACTFYVQNMFSLGCILLGVGIALIQIHLYASGALSTSPNRRRVHRDRVRSQAVHRDREWCRTRPRSRSTSAGGMCARFFLS